MRKLGKATITTVGKDALQAGSKLFTLSFQLLGMTASVLNQGLGVAVNATKRGFNNHGVEKPSQSAQQPFDFDDIDR